MTRRSFRTTIVRRIAIALTSLSAAGRVAAQRAPDSTRCDSIVGSRAAIVDSTSTAIFIFIEQTDYDWLAVDRGRMETRILRGFSAPRPFRLSVFEGPSLVGGLRISSPTDSTGVRREVSIHGTYRIELSRAGPMNGPVVVRASLLPGFDSAMVRAIRTASLMTNALNPPFGGSWHLQIRVSTDSLDDSRRLAEGMFPVMLVHDASSLTRRQLSFPEAARADDLDHGEAVLRFVVDRDGKAALETVEVVRASASVFARAAIVALSDQTFHPATIRGCPVAQVIEFPFIFDDRDHPRRTP